jgi:glyoxylase-like metal-dependent hydrolase (beta-lactamase superfamily II)
VLFQPRFQVQPAGNVTMIEQTDGLVLVDTGGSPGAGRRVVEAIRLVSPKPVKAVVITHWHGDHPQGLSEILRAWPDARTIATRATQAHLADPRTMNTPARPDPAANAAFQKRVEAFAAFTRRMGADAKTPAEAAGWAGAERLFNQYARDMDGALTLPVREGFDRRLDLPDRRAPAQVLFLGRANTDGDAIVWLPRQRVLVAGDIVAAPFPFGFGSYPADWIRTLTRLRSYPLKVLVPGHGAPQHDRAYIDRLTAALGEVRAKTAPLAAQSLGPAESARRIDLADQVRGFVGDDPWLRNWATTYWVAPIVASAYKEATGQPIVQSLKGD